MGAARTRSKVVKTFDWLDQPSMHRCGKCTYKSSRRCDVVKHRLKCIYYQHHRSKFGHITRKEMTLGIGPVKKPIPLNFLANQYRGGRKPLENYVCAICDGLEFSSTKEKNNHMRKHKKGLGVVYLAKLILLGLPYSYTRLSKY